MHKINRILLLIFLLILFISINAISYVDAVSQNLSQNVFRLHVIANSDSEEDQNLKYIVRDEVLEYVNSISKDIKNKSEMISLLEQNMDNIKEIAKNTIIEHGYNYNVNIEIGNFAFPTKTYGDISFPASYYDALKIEIGQSSGQNWWCVMFPPLCFVDVSSGIVPNESKKVLENNLSSEEYELVSTNEEEVSFKFKLIEFLQNINMKLAGI